MPASAFRQTRRKIALTIPGIDFNNARRPCTRSPLHVSCDIPRRHARITFLTVFRFLARLFAHLKQFGGTFVNASLSVRFRTDSAMTSIQSHGLFVAAIRRLHMRLFQL
jgi:hypothetical protein